jgi:hypothetical protein
MKRQVGIWFAPHFCAVHCNTMAEILLSRYEFFITHHMITHLNISEIEVRYGKRILSRFYEAVVIANLNLYPS